MQKARTALLGILCVVVCATCIVLLAMTVTLRDQVQAMQTSVDSLSSQVESQNAYLQNSISEMGARLSQSLEEQGSLFSKVEARLSYQQGELVLTANVLPKEVVAGTTYLLTLENDSQSVNMTSDGKNWTGTLRLEPAAEFTPVVVIQSASGARQEALDTLYPDNILAVEGDSIWSWNRSETGSAPQNQSDNILYLALVPNGDGPVASPSDLDRVVLTIQDDSGAVLEAMDITATEAPEGDTRLWYMADLSAYMEEETCSIHLYITLETVSGLTLSDPSNESASYAQDPQGSSSGSGNLSFSPQW